MEKKKEEVLDMNENLEKAESFVVKYKKPIAIAAIAIVAIVAGTLLYHALYAAPRADKASTAIAKGQEYFKTTTTVPSFMNEGPNFFLYPIYHNETDWQDGMYHTGFSQNYRVSVAGGDDVAMYNLSLGYTQGEAVARTNDFNRLNIRFNSDITMFKGLTTGFDISYVRNAYNLRDNGWAPDYSASNISSPNVLSLIQSPFISPYAHYVFYDPANGLAVGHTDKV